MQTEDGSIRRLFFARDRADKRDITEQHKEMLAHLEKTGFDVRVVTQDENHLIYYGLHKTRP